MGASNWNAALWCTHFAGSRWFGRKSALFDWYSNRINWASRLKLSQLELCWSTGPIVRPLQRNRDQIWTKDPWKSYMNYFRNMMCQDSHFYWRDYNSNLFNKLYYLVSKRYRNRYSKNISKKFLTVCSLPRSLVSSHNWQRRTLWGNTGCTRYGRQTARERSRRICKRMNKKCCTWISYLLQYPP